MGKYSSNGGVIKKAVQKVMQKRENNNLNE
jgi:hypothetical protein